MSAADSDRATRARHAPNEWWIVAGIAVVSMIATLLATRQWGVGLRSDSVAYFVISDKLRGGDWSALPTVWPPLYPAALAAGAAVTGQTAAEVARWIGAGAGAVLVVLAGVAARRTIGSTVLRYCSVMLIAASPALLAQHVYALSDAPFAAATFAALLVIARSVARPSLPTLAAACVLVWIAFGLRYPGLYLVPVGMLALLVLPREVPRRARLGWSLGFAAGSLALPVAWMLRNRAVDGSLLGPRLTADEGIRRNTMDTAASLGRAMTGYDSLPTVAAALVAAAGVCALVAGALWVRRNTDPRNDMPGHVLDDRVVWILASYCIAHLVLSDVTRSLVGFDRIDVRLISSTIAPLIIVTVAVVDRVAARFAAPSRRKVVYAGAIAFTAIISLLGCRSLWLTHRDGGFWNGREYAAVRADPALQSIPADCTIYANVTAPLWYAGRLTEQSPNRFGYGSTTEVDDLDRFRDTARRTPVCLVWIDRAWTASTAYRPEELAKIVPMSEIVRGPEVVVYRST